MIIHMPLRAGHTGVHTGGAFEGAGRPQVGHTGTAVLLQQRHWAAWNKHH